MQNSKKYAIGNIANIRQYRAILLKFDDKLPFGGEMGLPRVGIIAFNGMLPFMFSIPYTVFSLSIPDRLFDVSVFSIDDGNVRLDGFMDITPTKTLFECDKMDILVIPGWAELNEPPSQEFMDILKAADKAGLLMVGLCYGTYPLAYAGLLEGRKATTHWLAEKDFKARFPNVLLNENSLYVEDGHFITSAGSAAGIDCCIYVINKLYGYGIANAAARQMISSPYRNGGQAQFMDMKIEPSRSEEINAITDFLTENIVTEFSLDKLAEKFSMSKRTLIRRFENSTGTSIKKWVTNLRLKKTCELLEATNWSIERIAEMVGFGSAGLLRHHFARKYHISPQRWRENFFNGTYNERA